MSIYLYHQHKLEIRIILLGIDLFYLLEFNNRVLWFRKVVCFELYLDMNKKFFQVRRTLKPRYFQRMSADLYLRMNDL